jgi:galactokinase
MATRGHAPRTVEASANGRVNLVGEHTDYNDGLVFPTLIPQRTVIAVRTRPDRVVRLDSDASGMGSTEASLDELRPRGSWSDHPLGVVDVLGRRGHVLGGFDAEVRSNVPIGAGLASSAALAVATARALRGAFHLALDDREIASVAHEAEHTFVGARVGMMDQLVCSLGRVGEALFVDTRSHQTRHVPLAQLDMDLAVIDSGVRHEHATGGYNTRRAECEDAAHRLGVLSLRDVAIDADLSGLPPTLQRRVRHVVSENERVLEALRAIERRDAVAFGAIVSAAHVSLRDDFEVSLPAIDTIVAAALDDAEVYGARLTGGGFGGSVLVVTHKGVARAVALRVVAASGTTARAVLPPEAGGSARVVGSRA